MRAGRRQCDEVSSVRGVSDSATARRALLKLLQLPELGDAPLPRQASDLLDLVDRLDAHPALLSKSSDGTLHEIRARLGDRWSSLILVLLRASAFRPATLRKVINLVARREGEISDRILTLQLRHLERDGLVQRTICSEMPLSIEYRITDLGRSLLVIWDQLRDWTFVHGTKVQAAQRAFDGRGT